MTTRRVTPFAGWALAVVLFLCSTASAAVLHPIPGAGGDGPAAVAASDDPPVVLDASIDFLGFLVDLTVTAALESLETVLRGAVGVP